MAAVACAEFGSAFSFAADVKAKPGYQVVCFEDPATREQFCFVPAKLTANGRARASPLYTGTGPDISITAFIAVADCDKATIALRDAKGATAKGAPKIDPRVAQALAQDMCAVAKPAIGKSLKS